MMDISQVFAVTKASTPIPCPVELQRTWLYILTAFISLGTGFADQGCLHLAAASSMLDAGNVGLADQVRLVNIRDAEICPLTGVAAYCLDKLLRYPVSNGQDLTTAYEGIASTLVR